MKAELFKLQCRQNYYSGITPSGKNSKETEGYKSLIRIAKEYFEQGKYDEFSGNFLEGHYLIPLWAAHLMVEWGKPD